MKVIQDTERDELIFAGNLKWFDPMKCFGFANRFA